MSSQPTKFHSCQWIPSGCSYSSDEEFTDLVVGHAAALFWHLISFTQYTLAKINYFITHRLIRAVKTIRLFLLCFISIAAKTLLNYESVSPYLKTNGPGGHKLDMLQRYHKRVSCSLSLFHLRPDLKSERSGQVARPSDSH